MSATSLPPIWMASIYQPWADLIVPDAAVRDRVLAGRWMMSASAGQLPKDVENRRRRISHRGLLAIHATEAVDPTMMAALDLVAGQVVRGAVVGVVDLVDVVDDSTSPWAQRGAVHWILSKPRRLLSPIACRGYQSPRPVPERAVETEIRRQLDAGLYSTLLQSV